MTDVPVSERPYYACCGLHGYHSWWCAENTYRDENIRQLALCWQQSEREVRSLADSAAAQGRGTQR